MLKPMLIALKVKLKHQPTQQQNKLNLFTMLKPLKSLKLTSLPSLIILIRKQPKLLSKTNMKLAKLR